jgi:23S rRNA (guanosine2251-2'-O)-methyltransferase
MRRLVAEHCDELARIPLAEGAESLNAAVALGVVLYQAGLSRG